MRLLHRALMAAIALCLLVAVSRGLGQAPGAPAVFASGIRADWHRGVSDANQHPPGACGIAGKCNIARRCCYC